MESSSLQELEQIPGVGITIARDMLNIGIHSIDALKGKQAMSVVPAKAGIISLVHWPRLFLYRP